MFTKDEIETIENFLIEMPDDSKVYLGCDSVKFKKNKEWFARYTVVVVIHLAGKNGCKVFGYSETERDYDPKADKPRMRLMNETYKVVEAYLLFGELLEGTDVEIHIDVNQQEAHNSSIVLREAVGYIMGMTQIEAKAKPDAFAASYAADRGARGQLPNV